MQSAARRKRYETARVIFHRVTDQVEDRLGAALGDRYAVEREIGRGGMATVYLAQDLKHRRPVAIKVLHEHLAANLGAERFLREIQIAARLQHPHIVPLYDSGQAGDLLYYVMPFIEGESLRRRLERETRLSLDETARVTRAVASALDYAHRQQIVHRDIKPENVLLHEGEAMVTDFGIAKAVRVAGRENLTQTGTSIGTPAYMSPEQAAGETDLDGRSDVYSLGVVAFEMLAGRTPFTGPNAQAIFAACLTQHPPGVRTLRSDVPEAADRAIALALAKTAGERFATAGQFAQALLQDRETYTPPGATTAAQTSGSRSIAVLPFVNMSADSENEYFSDGIAEEIINALTRVQALRVASRTSAFAFKGKTLDIRKIGEQLGVGTVLEGSVRKAGTRLRVTAQLVNVGDGYHLWSERYDRELADVFAVQDEIAENIVRALRLVLTEAERRAIERAAPADVRAYDYYLRGRQYFHQFRRTGMQFARRMFDRAIEADPRYALAYAGMADCCSFLYMYWDASKANLESAESGSQRALELAPELAEAHTSRGLAVSLSKRYAEAEQELETAIRLNPRLFEAHYFYARTCLVQGKLAEAVRHYEDASRVRPEDYQTSLLVQSPLHGLGRHAEAEAAMRRGLEIAERHLQLNPDDARAWYLGAGALVQLGEHERAAEWAGRALAIDRDDPSVLYNVACVYARGGRPDEAIESIKQAIRNGFGHREWLENDSDLDSVRGDPRFQALLANL